MAHDPCCVLVTGANGFLGFHIVKAVRKIGLEVVPTSRRGEGLTKLDIIDSKAIDEIFRKLQPRSVVNCAAYGVNYHEQNAQQAMQTNTVAALDLLEAAARFGAEKFIQIGSCFEYGSHDGPIPEDAKLKPTSNYAASKAAASLILGQRAGELGISFVVARPFGMWGSGEAEHRLVPQIVSAWKSGQPLELTACDVLRDYSYVSDIAEYIAKLLDVDSLPNGQVVNLASGQPVLLRNFVLDIADYLGIRNLMRFGARRHRKGEMKSLVGDIGYMRQLFGSVPQTTVTEGLQRMGVDLTGR